MKGSEEKENGGSRHDDTISRRAVMDFVGSMNMCDQISDDAYKDMICYLEDLPPAQPELIEKAAYIRGFEQGRTQGMIDAKEEVAQPELIRCKDCRHRDEETGFCEGRGWPMQLVPDDGFCDKGERREERI